MFNFFKKPEATTVDGILYEGRSWVKRLEVAAAETAKEADALTKQLVVVEKERDVLDATANEGKAILAYKELNLSYRKNYSLVT